MLARITMEAPVNRDVRIAGVGAVAAALAGCSQWAGLPPLFLHIAALATCLWVATRRLGLGLGVATVTTAWMLLLLAASVLAHPGPQASVIASILMLMLAAIAVMAARGLPQRGHRHHLGALASAGAGALVWALATLLSFVTPGGAGLSWLMYRDSTMNLWGLRALLEAGGLNSFTSTANGQPLQDALALALTPASAGLSADRGDVEAALVGYGSLWGVLIALGSLSLGSLCLTTLGRTHPPRLRNLLFAGFASLALLSQGITGVLIDYGQVNGHLAIVLVCTALLAARDARFAPELSLGVILSITALVMAGWIPLILVPVALACHVSWQHRTRLLTVLRSRTDVRGAWLAVGVISSAVAFLVWGLPQIQAVLATVEAEPSAGGVFGTVTFSRAGHWESYTNPASWAVACSLLVVTVALLVTRPRHRLARPTMTLLGALAVGTAIMVLPVRDRLAELPYFPAKYLWLATILLAAAAAGLASDPASRRSAGLRWLTVTAGLVTLVCVASAPQPPGLAWWRSSATDLIGGSHIGGRDAVVEQFLTVTDDETLVLPWRVDPSTDATVALMASAFAPTGQSLPFNATRYVLRYYRGDFSAQVACELAAADTRPVRLLTADPALEVELERACPGAVSVTLLSPGEPSAN